MTITLLRVLPRLLSLNGSLGNAEVLATRLRWWGVEVSVSNINPGESPSGRPDIVVWGHGTSSMAVPASDAIGPWRETFTPGRRRELTGLERAWVVTSSARKS